MKIKQPILDVHVTFLKSLEFSRFQKQAKRNFLDITIVSQRCEVMIDYKLTKSGRSYQETIIIVYGSYDLYLFPYHKESIRYMVHNITGIYKNGVLQSYYVNNEHIRVPSPDKKNSMQEIRSIILNCIPGYNQKPNKAPSFSL